MARFPIVQVFGKQLGEGEVGKSSYRSIWNSKSQSPWFADLTPF